MHRITFESPTIGELLETLARVVGAEATVTMTSGVEMDARSRAILTSSSERLLETYYHCDFEDCTCDPIAVTTAPNGEKQRFCRHHALEALVLDQPCEDCDEDGGHVRASLAIGGVVVCSRHAAYRLNHILAKEEA